MEKKIGIYLCTGCGIDKTIDFDELKDTIEDELNFEVLHTDPLVCGECVNKIKSDIDEKGLNKIIVGACSGRYFTERFDFGPGVLVERVPLREYVAWTQNREDFEEDDWDEDEHPIHEMAADYIRMASAKVENGEAPAPIDEEVNKDIMVVGGGVSGMSAALAVAKAGYKAVLVEKEDKLGGWAGKYHKVFPSEPPFTELVDPPVKGLVQEIDNNKNITVHTSTRVWNTKGQPGQFEVTLKNRSGEQVINIGAIVQATGFKPYDANNLKDKYGYGRLKNVVTAVELEEMVQNGGIKRPSDGQAPKRVAIVHCAGSRDKEHLPYCSAACCRTALKQSLYVRDMIKDSEVFLLYKDIRSPGLYEQFYEAVQQKEGVYLTKGEIAGVDGVDNEGIKVSLEDTLLGEPIDVEADLLVLATGIVPDATPIVDKPLVADPKKEEEEEEEEEKEEKAKDPSEFVLNLQYMQGPDAPTLKYGFPDSHFICFPYETRRTGIYMSGMVRAPMDIATARNDGLGAALKAIQSVEISDRGVAVHPRSGDASFPDFFLQRCTQCKRCTQECPFGTLDEDEKGTPMPNLLRCRRCGICMGACPERIISFKNYGPNMVSQMIKSIEIPDEEDEKPRVLVFMCENDAIPALDVAAMHRVKLPAWARIIPVRCIGSVNTVWIADALSNGFDGIMLLGCQRGDDYQCHFIRGSELAKIRMKNVQEKLEQLVLERERVKIESVEISDWEYVAGLINEFCEEIEELEPNPYKGF